ncbi:hypothetical protein HMPREF3207_01469 [Citrobacter koseri]|nr:hypothetical protein HMPREF3207_01469 [Citrobacter koseri]
MCFYLMRYQAIPCADNGSFTILTQTISMKVKQHRTKPAKPAFRASIPLHTYVSEPVM